MTILHENPKYKDLRFGIELEYERFREPAASNGVWSFTTDGSLRDNGIEIVSKPITYSS